MKTLAALLPLSLAQQGGFSVKQRQQSCDDQPCQNGGVCQPFNSNNGFKCDCAGTGYTGMYCDITQPKIVCGDSYMSVTLDKKMITEHGFKDDIDNLKFNGDGEGCTKDETDDNFVMTIKSPFSGCGTSSSTNDDGDFVFNNAISWKQLRRGLPGEAPVVQEIKLIDFNCVYEDQYKVSAEGGITPAITTVDAKTGLGNFTVELGLYRDQTFLQPYSENPVVKISNDVCVQLELKNSIREDVVLSASECWASSLPNGEGDRHELLLNKCANPDDPSLKVVQNGHSRKVQLCFEMFKWGEDMDQVYLDCNVNVCQSGGENINDCICRADHDYDIYYYSNYYYANYMKEMYENYKASQGGERKRRSGARQVRATGAIKLKSSNTAEEEEETTPDYTDFDGTKVENTPKEDISEEIHTQIQWTVVEELSAAEQAKLSEVSRAEYEITPDEVIETIIAEIEEDDSQITMIISIALMVAVVALGVCIAVYVQCRRKYAVQRNKIREMRKVKEFYNGVLKPYNHSSHLPEQGSEQLPTVTN
jgi:hypothetical protein